MLKYFRFDYETGDYYLINEKKGTQIKCDKNGELVKRFQMYNTGNMTYKKRLQLSQTNNVNYLSFT
jgi:hypothetical protein